MSFKIKYVYKCESSELIHNKYLDLLAAEMLFKCLLNTIKTCYICYQNCSKKRKSLFGGKGLNIYPLFDATTLSLVNN